MVASIDNLEAHGQPDFLAAMGASAKFRDTLTGRKEELWLTPMIQADLADFRHTDLRHRLLHGGLPPYFLSPALPEREFQEWMDAYWAKDIQELFRLERRHAFQTFLTRRTCKPSLFSIRERSVWWWRPTSSHRSAIATGTWL